MDITRCCLFSVASWVFLSSVLSSGNVKCSVELRSGDWLSYWWIFYFFPLRSSYVAFTVCCGSLSICTVKLHPVSSVVFGWIWADSRTLFKMLPDSSWTHSENRSLWSGHLGEGCWSLKSQNTGGPHHTDDVSSASTQVCNNHGNVLHPDIHTRQIFQFLMSNK